MMQRAVTAFMQQPASIIGLALKAIGHSLTFGMAAQGTWETAGKAVEVYQNGTFSAWNVVDVGLNALGMCASGRAAFSEGRRLANRIAASEAGQRVAVRIAKGNGSLRVLQTGGRQIDYKTYIKRLDTINIEYENTS